jgi:hypothetical protein
MRGTCKEGRSHVAFFQGFFPRAVIDKTRYVDELVVSKKNYSFKPNNFLILSLSLGL